MILILLEKLHSFTTLRMDGSVIAVSRKAKRRAADIAMEFIYTAEIEAS